MAEDAKSHRANRETVPVLICGGGPVGLALAAELGYQRIKCVARGAKRRYRSGSENEPTDHAHDGVLSSLGHCRAGEKSRLARNAPLRFCLCNEFDGISALPAKISIVHASARSLNYSPEAPRHCPQIFFDPVLLEHVSSLPAVTLRHRTRLDSFVEETDAAVAAQVTRSGIRQG